MPHLQCPHCRSVFQVQPGLPAGTHLACPGCRQWFQPPELPPAAPQAGTSSEPTVRCWKCGTRISEGEAVRREVRTAGFGGLVGGFFDVSNWGIAGRWERVDVCRRCAADLDEARARTWVWIKRIAIRLLIAFILIVVVEFILTWRH